MNELDAVTIQATAAVAFPIVVSALKQVLPALSGKASFWVNLALNVLVAIGATLGFGAPAATAIAVGLGGGLAGSKAVDLKKRGVAPQ